MRLRNRFLLAFYSAALVFISVVVGSCQTTITIAGQAPDFSQEAKVASYYDEVGDGGGVWAIESDIWDTIPFATETANSLGIVKNNNKFTIPPGKYIITADFTRYVVWAQWYSITDGLTVIPMTEEAGGRIHGTFSVKSTPKEYVLLGRQQNGITRYAYGTPSTTHPQRISSMTIMKIQ